MRNGCADTIVLNAAREPSERAFFGVAAALFAASVAATITWCASMSTMGEMSMPGGWTMSMAWMRMPGQSWLDAATAFLRMWVVMMIAMMLPVLLPTLWRYRKAMIRAGAGPLGWPTALAGLGYFTVWTMFGIAAFPAGAALATLEMQIPALARVVPLAVGAVVLIAGAFQFTSWKRYHLACCRKELACGHESGMAAGPAWRHGLRFGLQCGACCGNLMVVPLVLGVMDLRAMAAVTIAISVERLAARGERLARAIGVVIVGSGMFLIARGAVLI